jgi:hypothetical protein
MRLFIIEAFGGPHSTNGRIAHFTVQADSAEEALELVQNSPGGARFVNFDIVSAGTEPMAGEASIVEEEDGPYLMGSL